MKATASKGPKVEVELGSRLAAYARKAEGAALRELLDRQLCELAADLGLANSPAVEIQSSGTDRAVRIRVDGRVRPYPLTVFRRAWLAVAPAELRSLPLEAPPTDPAVFPDAWLAEIAESSDPARRDTVVGYVSRLVVETLSQHPECLLSRAEAETYFRGDDGGAVVTAEDGREILRRLLDLGVSLRQRELVRRLVHGSFAAGGDVPTAVEEVFARLARDRIEVRVHPQYLADLGVRFNGEPIRIDDEQLPEELREAGAAVLEHLIKLGVARHIVLVEAPDAPADEVEVLVNDHVGLPIPIAEPDEIVVHASPWKVGRGEGRVLVDPASGHRLSALTGDVAELEALGFAVTPAATFLAVVVTREIAPFLYRLVTIEDVERELGAVATWYPSLVNAALERVRPVLLVWLLRDLLRERVSARDLWSILNALLRQAGAPLGDDSSDYHVDLLRRELADRVAYDCMVDVTGDYLDVFETVPSFEERVLFAVDDGLKGEVIRADIREALLRGQAPADAVILTADGTRRQLHKLIADEFPSVYVLGRSEIPASVEVRRVASVSG